MRLEYLCIFFSSGTFVASAFSNSNDTLLIKTQDVESNQILNQLLNGTWDVDHSHIVEELELNIRVAMVAIIVIAISSLSRCPHGMYLLPSIISGHQPFQELVWWIQMAIAWPNGGSESGHLIIIAITNIINLLIRDVIMPSSCLLSLITSIITICRIWSWVNESRYEFL